MNGAAYWSAGGVFTSRQDGRKSRPETERFAASPGSSIQRFARLGQHAGLRRQCSTNPTFSPNCQVPTNRYKRTVRFSLCAVWPSRSISPVGIAGATHFSIPLSCRSTMWHVSSILCASCLLWSVADVASAQDQIHWQPNLETAQRVAAQSKRLVLIHFWAPWCKPCRQLEQGVFAQPETGKALEANFVMVKLNVDDSPATARMYYVSSLPTDVIITPNGHLVAALPSPLDGAAVHRDHESGRRRPPPFGRVRCARRTASQSPAYNPYGTQAMAASSAARTASGRHNNRRRGNSRHRSRSSRRCGQSHRLPGNR